MDDRDSDSDVLHSCPYLGLASDPSVHCSFLTTSHRCFRWPTPQPVDYQQQRLHCLAADFSDCSWFVSAVEDPPDRRRRTPSRAGPTVLLSMVVVALVIVGALVYFDPWSLLFPAASDSSRATSVTESSGSSPASAATSAAGPSSQPLVLALSPTPEPSPTGEKPGPTAAPSATVSPATAPIPRATATASRPTATPVRSVATPAATPSGMAGSAAVRVYTVKDGDNLYSLARTFGVTVQDLMKANKLQDGAVLRVGQTLVVPPAGQ